MHRHTNQVAEEAHADTGTHRTSARRSPSNRPAGARGVHDVSEDTQEDTHHEHLSELPGVGTSHEIGEVFDN